MAFATKTCSTHTRGDAFVSFHHSNRSNYFKLCTSIQSDLISFETCHVKAANIMSSSEPDQKGIFPKKGTSTRTAIASSSKKPTVTTQQSASSTAQQSSTNTKVKRTSSVPKSVGERVNRNRGRVELSVGTNTEPSSPRRKESNARDGDDLGSPWSNVNVSKKNWLKMFETMNMSAKM